MKLSLNWLKNYLDISYTPEKIAEMLTLIGLEVEGIEKVESVKGGLKGIVIGHVLNCEKHPDADRLSVTTVDCGTGETLNIVCGAPNVAQGQKVMVATIGTELYSADGEMWKIKKGKIRGIDSEGMICALDELGLGRDHSGIIVLPEDCKVGMEASKYYKIEDDYVFEIGLTPNRSDATSQLGVARDLLAYLRVNEAYTEDIKEPEISGFVTEKVAFNIDVEILDKKACPRYSGIMIANCTVGESPDWIKKLLTSIGIRPINNIVDITNFVLNELGQPLHAFDADKIDGRKIIVTNLEQGSDFITLDGITRKLSASDLMICDGNQKGLCIAGVFGGLESGVTPETKNIFLESACFDSTSIRRTSTRHNLRTDAAKIFEKGSDPNNTIFALKRTAALIQSISGGQISNELIDIYPKEIKPVEVRLFYSKVHDLIGTNISEDDIHAILQAMDMEITFIDDDSILVKVPTNKADVLRDVDLIEEIIRIYGLNRVPVPSKIQSTISYTNKPNKHKTREILSDFLASVGYNEMMGLSLIESKNYKEFDFADESSFVYINNTSNIHLDIMRPDMMISGLQSCAYNLNRQQTNLSLFEFGKSYEKIQSGYNEKEFLTLFMAGKKNEESWLSDNKAEKTFFDIKKTVLSILNRLGIGNYQASELLNDSRFSYGIKFHKGPLVLVEFGEIKKSICQKMGVKTNIFYAELSLEPILNDFGKQKMHVTEISRFPSVRRDLALILDKKVNFKEIELTAKSCEKKFLKHISLFDVYENEKQLGENKKSYAVSFLFESFEKTLQDKDIDQIMDKIISQLESKTGALIRK